MRVDVKLRYDILDVAELGSRNLHGLGELGHPFAKITKPLAHDVVRKEKRL
jgi:hypothetical protein